MRPRPVFAAAVKGATLPWNTLRIFALFMCFVVSVDTRLQRGGPRQFELRPDSPEFHDLIAAGAALEKVAGGFGFTEGPVWEPAGGYLYIDDEQQNRISRVFPDGRVETVLSIRDPDGAAFDRRHRLIVCLSTLRSVIAVDADGQYTALADRYDGKKLNSPNDVVLGPDGALYFTDPTIDLPRGETQELPTAVYRLGASPGTTQINVDGSRSPLPADADLTPLATDLAQPNGLAFSADGRRLYVSDTERREIRVYDFTGGPAGSLRNGRLFAKMDAPGGVPDGLRVDVNGNVFATGPLGVWVLDPAGRRLGTIVVPEQPANLAWGGADHSTLYVAARTSVYRLNTRTRGR